MTDISEAIRLTRHGFHIFPLRPGSKLPAIEAFPTRATREPEKIERWAKKYPDCNWGISTSKFGDDEALIVVDVDGAGHGKDGPGELVRLELDGKEFPVTCEHVTPSGGRHIIYRVPAPVRQGTDVLARGLDIRSKGGYIVAPGSRLPLGEYHVDRPATPVIAPEWLVSACGPARTRNPNLDALPGIDPERARHRAIEYLKTADRSVKGAGGDQTAYRVSAQCLALGATEAQTLDLMLSEHWDDGCGWSPDRLAEKVRHAAKYMQEPRGAEAPEAQFRPVEDGADRGVHPLQALNRSWAVVADPPHVLVYRMGSDPRTGQGKFDAYSKTSFFDLHANRPFQKGQNVAQAWWEWKDRRICSDGWEFAPGADLPPSVLNVWGGFAKQPVAGDWSLLREHVRTILCSGDERMFEYVMNWMARLFQKPGEPGQVALVLKGRLGTGKGTLGDALLTITGRHGIHLNNPQQLTGRFNGHLGDRVLVFADEAVFAGDKQTTAKLKAMLTEARLPVERKGVDIVQVRNCTHIVMASNENHVVPAAKDERRFCIMEVSDAKLGEEHRPYFAAIRDQLNAGGHEAMLYDLLARDISNFDVWAYPRTEAAFQQQVESMDGFDTWLHEALDSRLICCEEWRDEAVIVPKGEMYARYQETSRERREYTSLGVSQFWRKLKTLAERAGLTLGTRQAHGGERSIVLPGLEAFRSAFAKHMGGNVVWSD